MKSLTFHRALYSKAALLKAAYHFTDRFYVYLNQDDTNYSIELTAKPGVDEGSIELEFSNEILAQTTREEILRQTANIRTLLLGRAFGSTVVEEAQDYEDVAEESGNEKLFTDWYQV